MVVDKVGRGKARDVNARFLAMCSHYLFDPDFCNVASGWEKGVVEKNVQDSRRRIWIQAQQMLWRSFDELNAWLTDTEALHIDVPECVNDFASPGDINLVCNCRVV
jgi:transposase